MSTLFQNKYRIPSARLRNWNYADEGMYFVTVCTAGRDHYFGSISNGKMDLSEIGKIAESEWIKTPGLRPDMNLELGEFVVMPNHVHGIIMIGENKYNNARRDAMHRVSTNTNMVANPLDLTNIPGVSDIPNKPGFGPQSKNLASILRGYKSAVTTYARKNNIPFGWQSRFYDHIIRDDSSYSRISDYIAMNPGKWLDDKFNM